jgi:DNA (cytosine-5)-methyltransferase 1
MKLVDLFSGCGGMSLGFQNEGYEVLAAFDKWKPAISVYKDNFEHPIYEADLNDPVHQETINALRPDIIIGGPPCQDFSSAGKRDDTLGRADLTITFANIVTTARPKFFVMENVERIKKSRILDQAIDIFTNAGYGLTIKVLDASFCGVPQARKRFFMIGCLDEYDDFLLPYLEGNLGKDRMTIRDYFGSSLGIDHYYRHPRSYMRRGVFSIDEPSPTIRGVNRPIPKGYKPHHGDTAPLDNGLRPLTTKERSLIQTFPASFVLNGSKTNLEQAIGNAVPVKLAEYVARCIKEYVDGKKIKAYKPLAQVRMAMDPELDNNEVNAAM